MIGKKSMSIVENSNGEQSRYYDHPSKNLSGEKDFSEIDKEIKKTLEGKYLNENTNLSKSESSFNGQPTLYTKQTIWNDAKEEDNSHYQMKFLNYNNKFLLKTEKNFDVQQMINRAPNEKIEFNLNKIIANNTSKMTSDTPLNTLVPDYSDDVEEIYNINQINVLNTKTNNLSSLNQMMSLHESSSCKRAFTEPSVETPYRNYISNHSNNSNLLTYKDSENKRMFPLIEGANFQNEESFDYSVNEE